MRRAAAWAAALACALPGARAEDAVGVGHRESRDSDGLRMDRTFASWYVRRASEYEATSVAFESGGYAQGDWHRHAEAVTVAHRDVDRRTAEGLRLAVTLSSVGTRRLLGGDVDWNRVLSADTRLGIVASRDWVETPRALEDGIHYDLLGASIDRALGAGLTGVAFYARQSFSDGNARDHVRARLVYPLGDESGASLQVRYRGFVTHRQDVAGRYFNPDRYHQLLAVAALRRRFEPGWRIGAEAGYGRQWVADAGAAPSWLGSVSVDRVFADSSVVRLRWLQTRAASFGGPDYRYRTLALESELPF